MIKEKQKLVGNLSTKGSLSGSLSNSVIYVDPIIQEKEVTPTRNVQEITPDTGYTGLSKVTVKGYTPKVINKTITQNGIYSAEEEGLDGYDIVKVETSGVDINDYFKPTIAAATNVQYTNGINAIIKKIPDTITLTGDSCASMFQYCAAITTIPSLDTSGVTDMRKMFFNCNSLQTIPIIDTSKVTTMADMFYNCTSLQAIPAIDTAKVINFSDTFYRCSALTSLPLLNMSSATNLANILYNASNIIGIAGFTDLGNGYLTSTSANYYSYILNVSTCTKLTEQSIINVLNSLYDIATKGCKSQEVVMGATNLAKLTSEEGQQALSNAQAKGWTVR